MRCKLTTLESIYNGPFSLTVDKESKLIYTKSTLKDIYYTYNPSNLNPKIIYQNWTDYIYNLTNDLQISQFSLYNQTTK